MTVFSKFLRSNARRDLYSFAFLKEPCFCFVYFFVFWRIFYCPFSFWLHLIKLTVIITASICWVLSIWPTCSAGDPSSIPGSGRSAGEGIGYPLQYSWVSLVPQLVKNLLAMWETWVWSLGWEDPLEKGKATHSVFWPGEFHGLYSPWGQKESDMTEWLSLSI